MNSFASYTPVEANPEAAAEEKAFTHTIMRIDPFLDPLDPDSPRRRALTAVAGVEPAAAAGGARGIK